MSRAESQREAPSGFLSRSNKRLFFIGLPLALGAGVLTAFLRSSPADASRPKTATKIVMAEVQPGASLHPKPGALITEAGRAQRFAVWSQAVYEGEIDTTAVEALIAAERAEALEGNLRPQMREELRKHLFDTDQQIIRVGSQYHDEFQRVAALLRKRDGVVIIRTHPRQKDARWHDVEDMQQRMKNREGLVHSSYQRSLAPAGWQGELGEAPMAYVFAVWKEWPIWSRLKEKYDLILYQRILQSRRWIASEYGKQGMGLFRE